MQIRTNNVPRPVIDGFNLTADEQAKFDYIDWDAVERGEESPEFFRYKGELYDLGEFTNTRGLRDGGLSPLRKWDGYQEDSFFSGIVIRYVAEEGMIGDFDRIIVGTYFA